MNEINIYDFKVRANYPNFNTTRFFVQNKSKTTFPASFNYAFPEIEYTRHKEAKPEILKAHFFDIPCLLDEDKQKSKEYIQHLVNADNGSKESGKIIVSFREEYKTKIQEKIKSLKFTENDYVIPSATSTQPDEMLISQKASILLELIQQLYPVPDFCVLTSKAYSLNEKERKIHLEEALSNMGKMTDLKLGDSEAPLIFAIRCATSCYIPGLLPTYLNAGINETVYNALIKKYGVMIAGKIYLSNLQTIYKILFPENSGSDMCQPISSYFSITDIEKNIMFFRNEIEKNDNLLLTDPFYQVTFLINSAFKFFLNNQELIDTLKKGDFSFPAIIMQKMVWTIRNDDSYPGVLYSRHSRTGLGMQVESARNMFGDDIMTGTVERTDTEFFDRNEIREEYPAVYHFAPQLSGLEEKFKSPVTIEFAAETQRNIHLFAILQLNTSELTGRATLLSAIDLFKNKMIEKEKVINLLQPYHLRQIFSERIDDKSFRDLKFFSRGVSVLPRSAVSARIFFSASKALEAKGKGDKVCLCQEMFKPADTIILNKLDAIISLTPAAVHVVTACLGQGVPALINLQRYMVKIIGQMLVNSADGAIEEGSWITISSKYRMIFIGKAEFSPARFHKYLEGQKLVLLPKEEKVFINMKAAYSEYQNIIKDLGNTKIHNLNDLIKIIRNDLQNQPEKASKYANKWFDANMGLYIEQILKSDLGTHQDQHMFFDLLTTDRKILFFKKAILTCKKLQIKGYTAGSFMLGRFICVSNPIKFWNSLDKGEIAFLLNEYILFEKYLQVLNDLGEKHINRARTEIIREGINNVTLSHIESKVFMTLKLCFKNWTDLEKYHAPDLDVETLNLLNLLKNPFGFFYDYNSKWSLNSLKEICDTEGVALPKEKDV